MSESWLDCLRDEVAFRLRGGEQLADVERELIEPAQRLSDDERAALWLFAWSYPPTATRDARHLTGSMAR